MKKILLLLMALAWTLTGCEKDDICDAATPTTPRLIVNFYDINNPTALKTVTNLAIVGEGLEDGLLFNGKSTILMPLKTTADLTKYRFILNFGNDDTSLVNEDNLEFRYARSNVFISRACGFKTVFVLDAENPYILTDAAAPDELWIKDITLIQSLILTENEVHLQIYF